MPTDNDPPAYAMPQFLDANFGSFSLCDQSWPMGKDIADYAQTIALTPQKVLDDPRLHPKADGEVIAGTRRCWPASQTRRSRRIRAAIGLGLSSLRLHDRRWGASLNFVVGTTFVDRFCFWNVRSHFPIWLDHHMVRLNVRKEDLERIEFFDALAEYAGHGITSHLALALRLMYGGSTSVPAAELHALRDRFKALKRGKFSVPKLCLASIALCRTKGRSNTPHAMPNVPCHSGRATGTR